MFSIFNGFAALRKKSSLDLPVPVYPDYLGETSWIGSFLSRKKGSAVNVHFLVNQNLEIIKNPSSFSLISRFAEIKIRK